MSALKKLNLNRETLRRLSDAEAGQANGGFVLLSMAQPEFCMALTVAGRCPSMAGPCDSTITILNND